jgi:glycosyltransferase involved in cell wall biosynthesis
LRINYMDPALAGQGGHHLQWFERIGAALTAQGHELRAYVNRRASRATLEALSGRAKVVPVFESMPYYPPEKIDPLCGELAMFMVDMKHLPRALARVAPADAWVWPTLFAPQMAALAAAKVAVPVAACIHFPPDRSPQLGPAVWRYGAMLAATARIDLRIGLSVQELEPLYAPLLRRPLPVLPIPVDAGPPADLGSDVKTIGFFGGQANRKGAAILPTLVSRLLGQGFRVVLHDSSGRTAARLTAHPNLKVLGYLPDLPPAMAECDLVVAPYEPDAYRHMASGVVWEAISRGVPVIAPGDTAPGRFIQELGAGATFAVHSVDGICEAIDDVRAHWGRVSQAARQACEAWPDQHGVGHHVAALLQGVVPAGHDAVSAPW